uniref:Fork-head domain-containing protein n=1 Tax=Plectus sambesii TaxID=2011161 RepID=A0A914VD89_9BILA
MEPTATSSCGSSSSALPTVVEDELMPPLHRDRCYTWPLQPSTNSVMSLTNPTATNSDSSAAPSEENLAAAAAAKRKRSRKRNNETGSTKKPNPWGEESYSDLIAYALSCAPNGRMKLNEIYQWFADNRAYFRERSSQEEAAGWK